MRIGIANKSFGYLPVFLAARKGYFQDLGLDVEWSVLQGGGTTVAAAFLAGDIEMAGSTSYEVTEMQAAGKDAQIIYGLVKQQTWHLAVSKQFIADKKIDLGADYRDRIARLKGITLGAPQSFTPAG